MTTAQLETAELNINVDRLKQRMMDELQMSEEDIERATNLRFALNPDHQPSPGMATSNR
jgi:hypothetical protein